MTVKWDDEKWVLEEKAAEYFVAALNKQLGTAYRVVLHSDRPDIVIEDIHTHHSLGVEVTHLFYDDEEARFFLGRSGADRLQAEHIEVFIERLNRLLTQKSKKAKGYSNVRDLALLIRVMSPVFGVQDFTEVENLIEIPECNYRYIWLLFYNWETRKWDLIKFLKY